MLAGGSLHLLELFLLMEGNKSVLGKRYIYSEYDLNVVILIHQEATNVYDMFHTRWMLHNRAYQHKTTNIIQLMCIIHNNK